LRQGSILSRRQFMQGLLGASASLALLRPEHAWATPAPTTLSGNHIRLAIGETAVNYTGKPRLATTVNGSLPAPILRLRQGQHATISVTNRLAVPSSIHWHGLLLPYQMDGVPGISFPGIAPGATFTYRVPVRQSGTYWYHSHSGFQEQTGLYGAIVIEPEGGERFPAERDYVVLLSDWSDENPNAIFKHLRKQSDYYNYNEPTLIDLFRDIRQQSFDAALEERRMWSRMRMSPTDLADVTGHTYTYLMNGNSPQGNWTGLFQRGEKVRLRLINGSAMTYFDFRIPGLALQVVAADGQDVEPVSVDELRLAPAETCDVLVTPTADRAWTLFAQNIDRTGFAAGTLTPHPDLTAPFPAMDAPQPLTLADMPHGNMKTDSMGTNMSMDMDGMMHGHHAHMTAPAASTRLDDPGTGLQHSPRRVLTYADLHTLGGALDSRQPDRDITLHLTGNMQRYLWSFDNISAADAKPLTFRFGERLRLTLVNDTMMNHPIHLHGMWSEVVNADGAFQVRKHTVNVQPAQRLSYDVSANAPGRWAFHCHLLYHMHAGMFREVTVA
jgi:CopA family copper-resistance protein